MGRINGGELFVRTVRAHDIDVMFTLHGGHLDAIFQSCLDHKLRLIDTRHEAAAGHAADALSRLTRKPGIALVTAGPGFTNVITAIANASLDCIPTLFVAGAPPMREGETNPLQGGFSQVEMVKPVTKWAYQVTQTHQIPRLVAQALRIAQSGRPGPVFLEIPIDVLFSEVNGDAVQIPTPVRPKGGAAPSHADVAKALEMLASAQRPAILAGGGTLFAEASKSLAAFARTTSIPVFSNNKAHSVAAYCGDLNAGPFGNLAGLPSSERPDVALILGARLGLYTGGGTDRLLPFDTRLIHVDLDAREVGRLRDVEAPIIADCNSTLVALLEQAKACKWPTRAAWLEKIRVARTAQRAAFAETPRGDAELIHPFRAAEAVAEFIDESTTIVTDGGEAKSWIEMLAPFPAGSRYLSLGYLGCLGVGMPFAMAARVVDTSGTVICVTGDGSVGLNIQEFETMVRHQIPVVTVVFNNQCWGMSAHAQDLIFGASRRVVSDLAPTRYADVAAAFGCHAEQVEKLSELRPALRRALDSGKPACVNVMINPGTIAPYTSGMVGAWNREQEIVLPYYENIKK